MPVAEGVRQLSLKLRDVSLKTEADRMKILRPRTIVIAAMFVFLLGLTLGSAAKNNNNKGNENVIEDLATFAKVVEKVKSFYVDDVDTHQLIQDAIDAMLADLDPHSQYLSGLDYEDLKVNTEGMFGGLGIFISFKDNYPTVISGIEGTPADRAGIQSGDQIIEIEGESTAGWAVEKTVRHLRGQPGTAVRFKVTRPGLGEPIEYSLVREKISVESVTYSGMFGNVGYVKLSNFSKSTEQELHTALSELEAQGMKSFVLDLRSNPGGLLQAATAVSELFLDKDKLIVYTKGRYAQNNQKYYAGQTRKHTGYPIVVMVNGASASASEIVAGALQDWDAALVVGQTSFGKATVQTVFSLSDSQAVKLTTARYYTPSGRSIHKDEKTREHELETAASGSYPGDGRESASALKDQGTSAVANGSAVEAGADTTRPVFRTSSGRLVYGGGGITPDLEFEPQTYGELERRLERDQLFFTFALNYSMKNKVPQNFEVTDAILTQFKAMLKERKFEYEEKDFSGQSLEYVKKAILREVIAKNYGRKAMYRALLEKDPELQKVLEINAKAPSLDRMFSYVEKQKGEKKASLQ
jgi:carboxyl-terminal processing protease